MFFGSSVYKEIITAASERLAGFNAFIFPSEIGSAFVTIMCTGNWGRGRRYLGSFSVWVPLESMAAQHWMWGAVSKSPCLDEREAGSIKQPSISPAAGHGGPPAPLHADAFACENPSTQGKLTSGITWGDTASANFPHMLLSFKKYFPESKSLSVMTLFILKRSDLASTGYLPPGPVPCSHCQVTLFTNLNVKMKE